MKILIIEDEFMIRKKLRHLLEHLEIEGMCIDEIQEAEDGIDADQLLQDLAFDIVFTDINMPEMDGLSLLEKSAHYHPAAQWVIISGHDSFQYAQQAIYHGAKDYLLKPITRNKLNETMQRLVENIKKERNNFIEIDEIDEMLANLESAIWVLDGDLVKEIMRTWGDKVEKKHLKLSYYQSVMNHLLKTLVDRINQKGSISLDVTYHLKGEQIIHITTQFVENCLQVIDMAKVQRKGKFVDPIEVAKEYMKKNVCAKVNLEDVAQILGLNSSYFSQLFKRETGQTFVDYRIHLRMEAAKQLLERSNMRIIDISSEIGYDDAPHFTKTFKKYTGTSPKEYRQTLGIKA
ncbi:helix-turn-helix domain-containing protein [Bacillus sp. OK048]|uniref:response regulator transcription factor n=1 Tax=Bacillus sp. OK048 TaxID=1882761 RepID=UPI001587CA9A|nr:helix-turn-helix domain-containing protein [Bacillus sp. OK048]